MMLPGSLATTRPLRGAHVLQHGPSLGRPRRLALAQPSRWYPRRANDAMTCRVVGSDWLAPAREKRLITLAGGLLIELALTGGLFWSPLLCALLFVALTPSSGSQQASQEAAIKKAVDQVRREMESRVAVTPPESAGWMNRMMAEIWTPFVVPQMLKENLSAWQEKVRATAPSGWDIELQDFSLGVEGPTMSNYQVFNDPATGRMTAMECDMLMDSSTMRVVVRGSGPLGSFTATVLGVTMKGRMRVLPIPEQRMLLWSYMEPPDAKVRLQVRGPLIGERDVPEFSFIKSAFNAAIQDSLVEPRRAAVSLDYEYLVQQAVNTNINVYVESIDGFARPDPKDVTGSYDTETLDKAGLLLTSASTSLKIGGNAAVNSGRSGNKAGPDEAGAGRRAESSSKGGGSGSQGSTSTSLALAGNNIVPVPSPTPSLLAALRRRRAVHVVVRNLDTKLERRSATRLVSSEGRVALNELIHLELGGKTGIVELQVRDASRSQKVLGRVLIHVMATKDGCTLMWALGPHRESLALRWQPAMGPWRVSLPLENCSSPGATITLGLSADPWAYAAAQLPATAYKTPGPRTVLLQVMEGKELAARDWAGTSDPYVQIGYNGGLYRTRTIYNSLRPVWGETFVFSENPSLLTRRVRLDVWDSGVSRDDSLGHAAVSLDMAAENTIQDRWVQLAGEESGELRVRLVVVPGPQDSPAVQQMVTLLSSNAFATASTSTLQVVVVAARGLMPRPSSGSERNAYASITFAGARQNTPVIRGSTAPTWNYSSLFPLDLSANRHLHNQNPARNPSHKPHHNATIDVSPGSPGPIAGPSLQERSSSATPTATSVPDTSAEDAREPRGSTPARTPRQIRSWPLLTGNTPPPSGNSRSSTLQPYPPIPRDPARAGRRTREGSPPASSPSESQPAHTPAVLRVQIMDVAMVPPDENLGWAELDVALVVPSPGDVFEQWLPLKEGGNGEVLLRIAHMAPSASAQGALPLPQLTGTPTAVASAAAASSVTQAGTRDGYANDNSDSGLLSWVNHAVRSSVVGQMKAAEAVTASAVQTSQELRIKLGQDWIPKVQDWWGKTKGQVQGTIAATSKSATAKAKKRINKVRGKSERDSTDLQAPKESSPSPPETPRGAAPASPSPDTPHQGGGAQSSEGPQSSAPASDARTGDGAGYSRNGSEPSEAAATGKWRGVVTQSESTVASHTNNMAAAPLSDSSISNGLTTPAAGSTSHSRPEDSPSSTPTIGSKGGFWTETSSLQQPSSTAAALDGTQAAPGTQAAAPQAGPSGLTWLGAWLQGGWPSGPTDKSRHTKSRSRSPSAEHNAASGAESDSSNPNASAQETATAKQIDARISPDPQQQQQQQQQQQEDDDEEKPRPQAVDVQLTSPTGAAPGPAAPVGDRPAPRNGAAPFIGSDDVDMASRSRGASAGSDAGGPMQGQAEATPGQGSQPSMVRSGGRVNQGSMPPRGW